MNLFATTTTIDINDFIICNLPCTYKTKDKHTLVNGANDNNEKNREHHDHEAAESTEQQNNTENNAVTQHKNDPATQLYDMERMIGLLF